MDFCSAILAKLVYQVGQTQKDFVQHWKFVGGPCAQQEDFIIPGCGWRVGQMNRRASGRSQSE